MKKKCVKTISNKDKTKISLESKFKNYKDKNLAKEFSWDRSFWKREIIVLE